MVHDAFMCKIVHVRGGGEGRKGKKKEINPSREKYLDLEIRDSCVLGHGWFFSL